MVYIGNTEISNIYVGTTQISNAYVGSNQIYGDVSVDAVTFTAKQSNSTVGLNKISTEQIIEYSYDGEDWSGMTTGTTITLTNSGDSVYVRGMLTNNTNSASNYTRFTMSGDIKASGNINYLWNYSNPTASLKNYCGYFLFSDCTALTDASELRFPATTLARSCYMTMFQNCHGLTSVPSILPATTLADSCYRGMFQYTPITTAPELPATTLSTYCYQNMFRGCEHLNYIKCLATNKSATDCTYNWVSSVSSSGTFVKDPNMSGWTTGASGVPSGWTITDA